MSCATVYAIACDGSIRTAVDISNGSAGAPVIWDALCQKHLQVHSWMKFGNEPAPLDRLDELLRAGKLPEDDAVLLLFTYDRSWVRSGNISKLCAVLDRFWAWNSTVVDRYGGFPHKVGRINPTIPEIADALRKLCPTEVMGVCFQQTSVSECPWQLRGPEDENGDYECRMGNLLDDTWPAPSPFEIFDAVAAVLAKREVT